jgi:hypothetical protein
VVEVGGAGVVGLEESGIPRRTWLCGFLGLVLGRCSQQAVLGSIYEEPYDF